MAKIWQTKNIGVPGKYTKTSSSNSLYGRRTRGRGVFKWILAIVVVLAALYLLFFILPRVEITLVPESRTIEQEVQIRFSEQASRVNATDRIVPVQTLAVSNIVSSSFETTGEDNVGERARGTVNFFNLTGVEHQLLPEDGLENLDGLFFAVTTPVTIPAATVSADGDIVPGRISAEVVALEAGEASNLREQRLFISALTSDRQNKIYGEAPALNGGTTEIIRIASQDDLDQAQEALRNELRQKLLVEIKDNLPAATVILEDTFELSAEEFKAAVSLDEELTEFEASLQAEGRVLAYTEADLNSLLKDLVLKQLASGEQLVSETPMDLFLEDLPPSNPEAGISDINIKYEWAVSQRVDLEGLKQSVLGQREAEARRTLLADPTVDDVRFNWILAISKKIPKIPSHVTLKLRSE